MAKKHILVINPGSTSTKVAVFEDEKSIYTHVIRHNNLLLQKYKKVFEQKDFRKNNILNALAEHGFKLSEFDVIVARGGLLRPIAGGTYRVNEAMLRDLKVSKYGEHAANLGAIIADEIAKELNIAAYIVDPVVVDEMESIAKVTGLPEIKRKSKFHALNQKNVARKMANELGLEYNNTDFIVCHMGGGISVGVHYHGKVIDVNDALDGEGPFSPERSGSLPVGELISLCFSGEQSEKELRNKVVGKGGLVAHLGTNDAEEVEKMIKNGDEHATSIYDAMAYQIAKEIGKYSVVLKGKINHIILTGGLAYSEYLVNKIISYIDWIAEVTMYPGENELQALAEGVLRIFSDQAIEMEYMGED